MFHFPPATTPKAHMSFEPDAASYADDGSYLPILVVGDNDEYIVFVADADIVYHWGFAYPANEIVPSPWANAYV